MSGPLPDVRNRPRIFMMPRAWLLGLSSIMWLIPAFILIRFALSWTDQLDPGVMVASWALAAGMTLLGYALWFKRIVLGNIHRIRSLPEQSAVWNVTSPRGYGILAMMITLGIFLRSSELPRLYLAVPYALMGGCLLIGALHTAATFFRDLQPARNGS